MERVSGRLKYKPVWLVLGYLMIALVIQQTLTSAPMAVGFEMSDKLLHALGYFVLMGWFVQIYPGVSARMVWGLFFIAMGVVMEYLQGIGGIRHYEVNDMVANGLGVVIAWGMSYTGFSHILEKFEKRYL